MSPTLHLVTQRGQPYGSERRCCEMCGLMMVNRPDSFWSAHTWTDNPAHYRPWQNDLPAVIADMTPCWPAAQTPGGENG